MIQWLKQLFGLDGSTNQPHTPTPRSIVVSLMDEGDYHSGPAGYSPNTEYPETQYGSWFDEDAEWHDGH